MSTYGPSHAPPDLPYDPDSPEDPALPDDAELDDDDDDGGPCPDDPDGLHFAGCGCPDKDPWR
jgi:hypothetical protein